jgi:hypothetical protein
MEKEVTVTSVNKDGELEEVVEPLESKAEETPKPAEEPKSAEAAKPAGKPEDAAPPAAGEKPAEGEETPEEKAAKEAAAKAEEKPKPKGKTDTQKRIDKLTAEKHHLQGQLDAIREKPTQETATTEPAAQEDKEPKAEEFETYEEFTKALGKWSVRQEFKELQAQDAKEAEQEERKEIWNAYCERSDEARKVHDDFDEVISRDNPLPQAAMLAIIELDNGPEVAYYLAKNPEIRKGLLGLSPLKAVAEVGRVSAILAGTAQEAVKPPALHTGQEPGKTPVPPKVASSAPAPIEPVGVGATKTHVPLDDPSVSYAEYMRRRDAGET